MLRAFAQLSHIRHAAFMTGFVVVVAGCSSQNVAEPEAIVDLVGLTIEPRSANLLPGQSQSFQAQGITASGSKVAATVRWEATGGTIDDQGVFVAPADTGAYQVTATHTVRSWLSDTVVAVVQEAVSSTDPVATVTVAPATATIETGQTVQLAATPRDGAGNPLAGRDVAWSSSDPAVASVNGTGLVTAHATGSATITATSEGQSGTASVTVMPPSVASVRVTPASAVLLEGATLQLTATPLDAAGNPMPGGNVTWSSGAPAVVSVDGSGLVMAEAVGAAVITATVDGQNGTAAIGVTTPSSLSEPVYDPNNSQHVSHMYDDFAPYRTVDELATVTASGMPRPWSLPGGTGRLSFSEADPYTGEQTLDIDHMAAYTPGSKGLRGIGALNAGRTDVVVLEWALRYGGTSWYEGKSADHQVDAGRFNFDPTTSPLGSGFDCQADPYCSVYYDANLNPRVDGLPPRPNTFSPTIWVSSQYLPSGAGGTVKYKQNLNWGLEAGSFDWRRNADMRGVGTPANDDEWRLYKVRYTTPPAGFGAGYGRIEMWIGTQQGTMLKIMEWDGAPGGLWEGMVYVGEAELVPGSLNFYGLESRGFDGGSMVHLGYIRVWSHPRP